MANPHFDPYYKWLGIPASEQPPHLYRLLGVSLFETDLEVIENAANRQISHLKTCSIGPQGEVAQEILNEIHQAKIILLNSAKKLAYDARLLAAGWKLPNGDDGTNLADEQRTTVTQKQTEQPRQPALGFSTTQGAERRQSSAQSSSTQKNQAATFKVRSPSHRYSNSRLPKGGTRRKKKSGTVFTVIGLALGGVSGICVAIVLLWLIAESDPLGLFTTKQSITSTGNIRQPPSPSMTRRPKPPNQVIRKPNVRPAAPKTSDSTGIQNSTPEMNEDVSAARSNARLGSLIPKESSLRSNNIAPEPTANLGNLLTSQRDYMIGKRDWTLTPKETFTGSFSAYEDGMVSLQLETNVIRQVPIAQFETTDQILLGDALQFRQTPLQSSFTFNVASISLEESKSLHDEFPLSPYAGLFLAYILSEQSDAYNDYKGSQNILRDVETRIENQEMLSKSRHGATLSSVYNNQAILFIRDHNFNAAAASLAKSLAKNPGNTAALRNAFQLNKINDLSKGQRSRELLNVSSRTKLKKAFSSFTPRSPITAWSYSFDVNYPAELNQTGKLFTEINSVDWTTASASNTWCIPCQGNGVFACPACRGDGMVSTREAGTVQGDAVFGPVSLALPSVGKCRACNGSGGFDCRDCNRGRTR